MTGRCQRRWQRGWGAREDREEEDLGIRLGGIRFNVYFVFVLC